MAIANVENVNKMALSDAAKQTALDKAEVELEKAKADLK